MGSNDLRPRPHATSAEADCFRRRTHEPIRAALVALDPIGRTVSEINQLVVVLEFDYQSVCRRSQTCRASSAELPIDAETVGDGNRPNDDVSIRERVVMFARVVDDASELLHLRVVAQPVERPEHEVITVIVVSRRTGSSSALIPMHRYSVTTQSLPQG